MSFSEVTVESMEGNGNVESEPEKNTKLDNSHIGNMSSYIGVCGATFFGLDLALSQ